MNDHSWDDIREEVYRRANGCCEYCQTCEVNTGQTMQVDHIIPDGNDSLENLALSCWNCNNAKRQATFVYDDETQQSVPLFHPRQQHWRDHFEWSPDTTILIAKTAIGRVTIKRFRMNRPLLVIARQRWVRLGFHPPAS